MGHPLNPLLLSLSHTHKYIQIVSTFNQNSPFIHHQQIEILVKMGHQHHFSPSFMLDTENDQSWNFAENIYTHSADNMVIDGVQYTHCNHTTMLNGYSSLPHNLQIPNYQQDVAGPSDLSMYTHTPSAYIVPEDYRNQASSSNYHVNPFNEEYLFDIGVGNTRLQYKRKSGVQDGQSSSDVIMVNEPWQESQPTNFLQAPWHYHTKNPNGLSIGGENSLRNVRSRSIFDLEINTARNHLVNNLSCDFYTNSQPMDVSPSINLTPDHMSSAAHDSSSINHELDPFLQGSSSRSSPIAIAQQKNNHAVRNFPSSSVQSVRAVQSGYSQSQRPALTFRVSSSNLTDDRLQLANNNHPSHMRRPPSTLGWHTGNRRYRSSSKVNFHDRPTLEGLMIVDRSASYEARNPFDQHRDMRLDIDGMSYEELLALTESIGTVGTGLSYHLISMCMQESIYCSSDQIQEEGTCVICLEEYASMDDVGVLRVCGHDFHVGCIRKWLSIKNLCPVCKAEPMKHK